MELAALISDCRDVLDAKYKAREIALAHGRALTRTCANAIRALHRNEWEAARAALDTARTETAAVANALTAHPDLLFAGYVQDAHKELVEAEVLFALLQNAPLLPTPADLQIEVPAYLNGLAEAASEGRRAALDALRRGDTNEAARLLEAMDEILSALTTIDYPDAVTGGLRRTCDALRAVVERTRGDVTLAVLQTRLVDTLRNGPSAPS